MGDFGKIRDFLISESSLPNSKWKLIPGTPLRDPNKVSAQKEYFFRSFGAYPV